MPYLRLYDTNGRIQGQTQITWEPAIPHRQHWWQLWRARLPVSYPVQTATDAVFRPSLEGYFLHEFGIELPGFGEVKVRAPWHYIPVGADVTIAKAWRMSIT